MDDEKSVPDCFNAAGRKGIDHEDSPGRQKHHQEPEIAHEADIPGDGRDGQGKGESYPLPQVPQLSPKPEKLKN